MNGQADGQAGPGLIRIRGCTKPEGPESVKTRCSRASVLGQSAGRFLISLHCQTTSRWQWTRGPFCLHQGKSEKVETCRLTLQPVPPFAALPPTSTGAHAAVGGCVATGWLRHPGASAGAPAARRTAHRVRQEAYLFRVLLPGGLQDDGGFSARRGCTAPAACADAWPGRRCDPPAHVVGQRELTLSAQPHDGGPQSTQARFATQPRQRRTLLHSWSHPWRAATSSGSAVGRLWRYRR